MDFMVHLIHIFMIVIDEVNLMFVIFIYDVGIIVTHLSVDLILEIVIYLNFLLLEGD